ncbi:MAG: helix-turn-helix domain-containing protein [Actinomycetota bacterium]|nr:helix-turn-helix domain-containing protein [Actinomycetota bacterium]
MSGDTVWAAGHTCGAAPASAALPEGLAAYRLLTSDEAALLPGVPVATLRRWRSRRRGYGPRAVQVGGSIRYRLAGLLAWIDEHTVTPDGRAQEGIEASRRGNASAAGLSALTRHRRSAGTTLLAGARHPRSAPAD